MAATLILVNRKIVKPVGFLSKIMIYVVKKLATLVFRDIFGGPYWSIGIVSEIVKIHIYEVPSFL